MVEPENKGIADLWRAPLYPCLLALGFKLFGSHDIVVICVTGFCYILLVFTVYLLARFHCSSYTAFVTALLVLVLPEISWYAISCLREPLFSLIFFLTAYSIWQKKNPYLLGFLCALTYLTRYNFVFFIPPFLAYIYSKCSSKKERFSYLGKWILAFVITLSPWMLRNVSLNQKPLFTLQHYELALFTPVYPHYTAYRSLDTPKTMDFLQKYPDLVWQKTFYYGLLNYWPQAFHLSPLSHKNIFRAFNFTGVEKEDVSPPDKTLSDLWQVHNNRFSLFLLSTFFFLFCIWILSAFQNQKNSNTKEKAFRDYFLFALIFGGLLQFICLLPIHPVARHFVSFAPFIIFYMMQKLEKESSWFAQRKTLSKAVFFLLIILGLLQLFFSKGFSSSFLSSLEQEKKIWLEKVPSSDYIMTNIPFPLSWKSERKVIWLPFMKSDYHKLEKKLGKIRYLYLHRKGYSTWVNTDPKLQTYLLKHYRLIYQTSFSEFYQKIEAR